MPISAYCVIVEKCIINYAKIRMFYDFFGHDVVQKCTSGIVHMFLGVACEGDVNHSAPMYSAVSASEVASPHNAEIGTFCEIIIVTAIGCLMQHC